MERDVLQTPHPTLPEQRPRATLVFLSDLSHQVILPFSGPAKPWPSIGPERSATTT